MTEEGQTEKWIACVTSKEDNIESALRKREIEFSPAEGYRDENGNLHLTIGDWVLYCRETSSNLRVISLLPREEVEEDTEEFRGEYSSVASLVYALENTKE